MQKQILLTTGALLCCAAGTTTSGKDIGRPNVVFIYADDMGMGILSHYGQKYISTPNIDRIFARGTAFENAHGCQYSAPSRGSMLTGYHDCHGDKWVISGGGQFAKENIEEVIEGVEARINKNDKPLAKNDLHLSQVFKRAGYTTGQVGKLEWGFTATRQQMRDHEWDYYYGYLDHVRCHGYYPPFLFDNGEIDYIEGNTIVNCGRGSENNSPEQYVARWNLEGKAVYSQNIFIEKIIEFIRDNKDNPFFLYHPTQLPHGPVAVPAIHPDFVDHPELSKIEREYASMVKMLDDHVGIILAELEELGILDNTIVVFSADNGHETYYTDGRICSKRPFCDLDGNLLDKWGYTFTSERVGDKFNGNHGMTGKKWSTFEGGIRVPLAFMWEGHIKSGKTSMQLAANYDLLTTFADMFDVKLETKKDGVSLAPILFTGKKALKETRYVYFSDRDNIGNAIIDSDGWKLRHNKKTDEYQLFNVVMDVNESKTLNDEYPEELERLKTFQVR